MTMPYCRQRARSRVCLHAIAGGLLARVPLLAAAVLIGGWTGAAAAPRTPERTGYFIEFLARPTEFGVDHAFVQIGRTGADGRDRIASTIAFFPLAYPNIDLTSPLFDTIGSVRTVPEDHAANASVRHRVEVDAATHAKAIAHGERMRRSWRYYDLATRNCNAVIFEYADRLGLAVPRAPADLSANLIRKMSELNGERRRVGWRKRAGS